MMRTLPTHRPKIKLCGFTREPDVRSACALGADYLGFVFYEHSPRCVPPAQAAQLVQCMAECKTPHAVPVGLFVNHSAAQVVAAVHTSGVQVLQFHGTETPSFCEGLSQRLGLPYWKAVHVAPDTHSDALLKLCQSYNGAQALLFDTASPGLVNVWGGTGHTFEWHTLAPLAHLKNVPPLVLSGGLSAQNVAQGITLLSPWAVDVSSGIEAVDGQGQPLKGIKDPLKMAAFVAAVRSTN